MYNSHRCGNIPNVSFSSFCQALQYRINFWPSVIRQWVANEIRAIDFIKAEVEITSILQGLDLVLQSQTILSEITLYPIMIITSSVGIIPMRIW